jgi:hypothetical protein
VQLGFERALPADTGRPAYHPGTVLKIYTYGYLNRVQSSRRLEREAQRNVELIWLTGRLMPDFKTIAEDKLATVKTQMKRLRQIEHQLIEAPDQQVSLTDPDARSMATSGRGTGIVAFVGSGQRLTAGTPRWRRVTAGSKRAIVRSPPVSGRTLTAGIRLQ